jgi:hypothetical protein
MTDDRRWGGFEPALDDMLDDPIVRAVMARDGICEHDLRRLVARATTARADPARVALR